MLALNTSVANGPKPDLRLFVSGQLICRPLICQGPRIEHEVRRLACPIAQEGHACMVAAIDNELIARQGITVMGAPFSNSRAAIAQRTLIVAEQYAFLIAFSTMGGITWASAIFASCAHPQRKYRRCCLRLC
jgi:hypothetical protein